MANDPYTIRIFVEDGDPDGVRIIDHMNWTGQAVVFPRDKWADIQPERTLMNQAYMSLLGTHRVMMIYLRFTLVKEMA